MSGFMHVHLVALRYFGETVRRGSMRQAAETLHVAASAINRQIMKLEDQLQCKLFERRAEGVRLTAAGEVLYRHILTLERDLDRAISEIDDLRGLRRGHVTIACEDGIARDFLPDILGRFHREFARVTYAVEIGAAPRIVAQVAAGDADIGLAMSPPKRNDVSVEAETVIPMGVIAAPDHSLAGRASLKLSDLFNERMIELRDGNGGGIDAYALVSGWMSRKQFVETNASDSMTNLVKAGLGVGLRSPIGIMRDIRARELVFIPVHDSLGHPPRLTICVKQQRTLPVAGAILLERLKAGLTAFSELIDQTLKSSGRTDAAEGRGAVATSATVR